MKLLLDTCAVIWSGLAPEHLSAAAAAALTDPESEISVASITAAEVACAQERGRISLDRHWKPWLREALSVNGWRVVSASWDVVEEAYSLPEPFHRDPADRLIVASARVHGLQVVTADRLLLAYPHVDTLW